MSTRYIEVRSVELPSELSLDLARHLPCRMLISRVAILVERPTVFAPVLGKRWASVVHDMERERSSTLQSSRRQELTRQVDLMKTAIFSIRSPNAAPQARVYILNNIADIPADCRTIYATTVLSPDQLDQLVCLLPEGGVIVMYGEWGQDYQRVVDKHSCRPP